MGITKNLAYHLPASQLHVIYSNMIHTYITDKTYSLAHLQCAAKVEIRFCRCGREYISLVMYVGSQLSSRSLVQTTQLAIVN